MRNAVFVVKSFKMMKLFHNCHVIKNIFFVKFALTIGHVKMIHVHFVDKYLKKIR